MGQHALLLLLLLLLRNMCCTRREGDLHEGRAQPSHQLSSWAQKEERSGDCSAAGDEHHPQLCRVRLWHSWDRDQGSEYRKLLLTAQCQRPSQQKDCTPDRCEYERRDARPSQRCSRHTSSIGIKQRSELLEEQLAHAIVLNQLPQAFDEGRRRDDSPDQRRRGEMGVVVPHPRERETSASEVPDCRACRSARVESAEPCLSPALFVRVRALRTGCPGSVSKRTLNQLAP